MSSMDILESLNLGKLEPFGPSDWMNSAGIDYIDIVAAMGHEGRLDPLVVKREHFPWPSKEGEDFAELSLAVHGLGIHLLASPLEYGEDSWFALYRDNEMSKWSLDELQHFLDVANKVIEMDDFMEIYDFFQNEAKGECNIEGFASEAEIRKYAATKRQHISVSDFDESVIEKSLIEGRVDVEKRVISGVTYYGKVGSLRLHREDGPAIIRPDGTKEWWVDGVRHRTDGPAIDNADGSKTWFLNGHRHRTDGPSYEGADGTKTWHINGKQHREDGPALEHADGTKEWWLNGEKVEPFANREDLSASDFDESKISEALEEEEVEAKKEGELLVYYKKGTKIRHRTDGPACEWKGGAKEWYRDGKLHREDGPASDAPDGTQQWYINGLPHREDGPAIVLPNGDKRWGQHGKLHREDGPAVEYADGRKEYWIEGQRVDPFTNREHLSTTSFDESRILEALDVRKMEDGSTRHFKSGTKILHREDGPAVIRPDGTKMWWLNGKLHREDGPAIEWSDGSKEWHQNGEMHREDGPAYEVEGGRKEWWLKGAKVKPFVHRKDVVVDNFDESSETSERVEEGDDIYYFKTGTSILHRTDGPAIISRHGVQSWYKNGRLHRDDGPAIVWSNGKEEWWLEGVPVDPFVGRKDLSAANFDESSEPKEDKFGVKRHYKPGTQILHREDGPAVIHAKGYKWFLNGQLHRENGPAVENFDSGEKEWHRHGLLHNDNGPAIDWGDGNYCYYINGERVPAPTKENMTVNNFDESVILEALDQTTRVERSDSIQYFKKGTNNLHREDGPAVIRPDGTKKWYINGRLHREDGPAIEERGDLSWFRRGKLHREGGPAVVWDDGTKKWFVNDMKHREDGPAVEHGWGDKEWWIRNKEHREDGPAVERVDGTKEWWLNGKRHREGGPAVERADGTKEWWWKGRFVEAPINREDLHVTDFDESVIQEALKNNSKGFKTACRAMLELSRKLVSFDSWEKLGDEVLSLSNPGWKKMKMADPLSIARSLYKDYGVSVHCVLISIADNKQIHAAPDKVSWSKSHNKFTVWGSTPTLAYSVSYWDLVYIVFEDPSELVPIDQIEKELQSGDAAAFSKITVNRAQQVLTLAKCLNFIGLSDPVGRAAYCYAGMAPSYFYEFMEKAIAARATTAQKWGAQFMMGVSISRSEKFLPKDPLWDVASFVSDLSPNDFPESKFKVGKAVEVLPGASFSVFRRTQKVGLATVIGIEKTDKGFTYYVELIDKEDWANGVIKYLSTREEHLQHPPTRDTIYLQDFDESKIAEALDCDRKVDKNGDVRYYKPGTEILHREDGPAIIFADGAKEWYIDGERHREDGPSIEGHGIKYWHRHGHLHRDDGPAIESDRGGAEYFVNGVYQEKPPTRKDLSSNNFDESSEESLDKSVDYDTGEIRYYKKGTNILHRKDGPAIELPKSDAEYWYLNGKKHREGGPAFIFPDGDKEWWLDGKMHREDGPAYEGADGSKEWFIQGFRHREDGPAMIYRGGKSWWLNGRKVEPFADRGDLSDTNFDESIIESVLGEESEELDRKVSAAGTVRYYKKGTNMLHREDGPAVERANGNQEWWQNGEVHRDGGPALIRKDSSKTWYQHDKLHREDGPAYEEADGTKEWYLDGVRVEPFATRENLPIVDFDESRKALKSEYPDLDKSAGVGWVWYTLKGTRILHREDGPAQILFDGHVKRWYNHGKKHRLDGPAVDNADGTKEWWVDGVRHRTDGPALISHGIEKWFFNGEEVDPPVNRDELQTTDFDESVIEKVLKEESKELDIHVNELGTVRYYKKGTKTLHREDGPAEEGSDGSKTWYRNGEVHREDGPAYEGARGTKVWYKNGKLHREDGPAEEGADGFKQWWLDGRKVEPFTNREDLSATDFDESVIEKVLNESIPTSELEKEERDGWVIYKIPGTHHLHREDGPAAVHSDGRENWYLNGQLHREDGPAEVTSDGQTRWYRHGLIHRDDGPAIIYANGSQQWRKNGVVHREDGPAIIGHDGFEIWMIDGQRVPAPKNAKRDELSRADFDESLMHKLSVAIA